MDLQYDTLCYILFINIKNKIFSRVLNDKRCELRQTAINFFVIIKTNLLHLLQKRYATKFHVSSMK